MKTIITAIALSLAVTPAMSMNIGSITPTLTFPDPAPEPVTKDQTGINQ